VIESKRVESIGEARAAAGALFFNQDGRVLLVRPTYKSGWEIPGGYLRPGETPTEAAAREVAEELGIRPPIGRLLVADWAPHPAEGDKILFVFDGGPLGPDQAGLIRPDPVEIAGWAFHDPDLLGMLLPARLARRITAALDARSAAHTAYLEHGHRVQAAVVA
jgi:8-oxo-dGTP diphosphatase